MLKGKEIYYCKPVFRPPSEGKSLLIQVTEGCSFKCDFCMSNLRKKFLIREFEDIKKDLDIAKQNFLIRWKCNGHAYRKTTWNTYLY